MDHLLLVMEEEGVLDTKASHINRIVLFIKKKGKGSFSQSGFEEACTTCGLSPRDFLEKDLKEIKRLLP